MNNNFLNDINGLIKVKEREKTLPKNNITYFNPTGTALPWVDTRISEEALNFLKDISSTFTAEQRHLLETKHGAGNVRRCDLIDKDNWFYENVLKTQVEEMSAESWKYHSKVPQSQKQELKLEHMWGNFQQYHDHVPLHNHGGVYSFIVFIEIPTRWEDQHICPQDDVPLGSAASDLAFVWAESKGAPCITHNFFLSPEDEGRMLLFPSWLQHMVYPFYDCEEARITISGNINYLNPPSPPSAQDFKVEENKKSNKSKQTEGNTHSTEDPEEIQKIMKTMKRFGKLKGM